MEPSAASARLAALAQSPVPSVVYGITAVRMEDGQVTEVMMGMVDRSLEHWDLRPAPTRLVEVVDRLVEGDTIVTLFPTESGRLQLGPEVQVDVLPNGVEKLALAEERAGQRLADLPRF